MKFSLTLLLSASLMLGILAPMPVDAAPTRKSSKKTTKGKKKSEKTKKKKAKKNASAQQISYQTAEQLADIDLKNPPAELQKKAQTQLKKLGITPEIYEESLELAVIDGSISILQNLLLAGQTQQSLDMAFDAAISHGIPRSFRYPNDQREISAKLLLEAGALASGITPTHLALCRSRELDAIVRNSPQYKPGSTLSEALQSGDVEAAKKLLSESAASSQVDFRLISHVLRRDDHELIQPLAQALLEQGKKQSKGKDITIANIYNSIMEPAIISNASNCIRQILATGEKMNLSNYLQKAVRNPGVVRQQPNPELLLQLIEAGACTDAIKQDVLDCLMQYGFGECIAALSAKVSVPPVIAAIATDNAEELAAVLKKDKQDINAPIWKKEKSEHTLLSFAAHCGSIKCLNHLLSQKSIDINHEVHNADVASYFQPDSKYSPLAMAARQGRVECAKALIDHPDLNLESNDNLVHIINSNNEELLKLYLKQAGSHVNLPTQYTFAPMTPLSCSINGMHLASTLILLNTKGIDLNNPVNGTTPLHVAASTLSSTSPALLQILLHHGADPEITNARGQNAIEHLESAGNNLFIDKIPSVRNIINPKDKGPSQNEIIEKHIQILTSGAHGK